MLVKSFMAPLTTLNMDICDVFLPDWAKQPPEELRAKVLNSRLVEPSYIVPSELDPLVWWNEWSQAHEVKKPTEQYLRCGTGWRCKTVINMEGAVFRRKNGWAYKIGTMFITARGVGIKKVDARRAAYTEVYDVLTASRCVDLMMGANPLEIFDGLTTEFDYTCNIVSSRAVNAVEYLWKSRSNNVQFAYAVSRGSRTAEDLNRNAALVLWNLLSNDYDSPTWSSSVSELEIFTPSSWYERHRGRKYLKRGITNIVGLLRTCWRPREWTPQDVEITTEENDNNNNNRNASRSQKKPKKGDQGSTIKKEKAANAPLKEDQAKANKDNETIVSKTADFVDKNFGYVPYVGTIAKGVSGISRLGRRLGFWDRPQESITDCSAAGMVDGKVDATPLAVSAIDWSPSFHDVCNQEEWEGDIMKILKIPSRVAVKTWDTTDSRGVALLELDVCPQACHTGLHYETGTPHAFKDVIYHTSNLAYFSEFYAMWRGTIRYTIEVVSSQFQQGQLYIAFCPDPITAAVSFDKARTLNGITLDIGGSDQRVTFDVPFFSELDYRFAHRRENYPKAGPAPTNSELYQKVYLDGTGHGHPNDGSMTQFWRTGQLLIYVQNTLRVNSAAVPTSVDINVYTEAGDDFEFVMPAQSQLYTTLPEVNTEVHYQYVMDGKTFDVINNFVFSNEKPITVSFPTDDLNSNDNNNNRRHRPRSIFTRVRPRFVQEPLFDFMVMGDGDHQRPFVDMINAPDMWGDWVSWDVDSDDEDDDFDDLDDIPLHAVEAWVQFPMDLNDNNNNNNVINGGDRTVNPVYEPAITDEFRKTADAHVVDTKAMTATTDNVLGIEYLIDVTGTITNGSGVGWLIKKLDWPKAFFDPERAPMGLAEYHNFFRSDVRIKIQLPPTSFHQGQLLVYYDPISGQDGDSEATDGTVSWFSTPLNLPHALVPIGRCTTAEFIVPYSSFLRLSNMKAGTDDFRDLGQIRVVTWNRMRNGTGASPSLNYTISAELIEPYIGLKTIKSTPYTDSLNVNNNSNAEQSNIAAEDPVRSSAHQDDLPHGEPEGWVESDHMNIKSLLYRAIPVADVTVSIEAVGGDIKPKSLYCVALEGPVNLRGMQRAISLPFSFWSGSIDYTFQSAMSNTWKGSMEIAMFPHPQTSASGDIWTVPTAAADFRTKHKEWSYNFSSLQNMALWVPAREHVKRLSCRQYTPNPLLPTGTGKGDKIPWYRTLGNLHVTAKLAPSLDVEYNKDAYMHGYSFKVWSNVGEDFRLYYLRNTPIIKGVDANPTKRDNSHTPELIRTESVCSEDSWVKDLCADGDVEANPGPNDTDGFNTAAGNFSKIFDLSFEFVRNFLSQVLQKGKQVCANVLMLLSEQVKSLEQYILGRTLSNINDRFKDITKMSLQDFCMSFLKIVSNVFMAKWILTKFAYVVEGKQNVESFLMDVAVYTSHPWAVGTIDLLTSLITKLKFRYEAGVDPDVWARILSFAMSVIVGMLGLPGVPDGLEKIIQRELAVLSIRSCYGIVVKVFTYLIDYYFSPETDETKAADKYLDDHIEDIQKACVAFDRCVADGSFEGQTLHMNTDAYEVLVFCRQTVERIAPYVHVSRKYPRLLMWTNKVMQIWDKVRKAKVAVARRPEPIGIVLSGDAGCGKSYATTFLLPEVILPQLGFCDRESSTKLVYPMPNNPEQSYFDNYWGQPWPVYDDLGATTEGKEWLTMLNFISMSDAPVNMAHLDDKGQIFVSPFLAASTNLTSLDPVNSLNNIEAMDRRFPFAYTMKVNSEFKSVDGTLDIARVIAGAEAAPTFEDELLFYDRVWSLNQWKMSSGDVGASITFSEVVRNIVCKYVERRSIMNRLKMKKKEPPLFQLGALLNTNNNNNVEWSRKRETLHHIMLHGRQEDFEEFCSDLMDDLEFEVIDPIPIIDVWAKCPLSKYASWNTLAAWALQQSDFKVVMSGLAARASTQWRTRKFWHINDKTEGFGTFKSHFYINTHLCGCGPYPERLYPVDIISDWQEKVVKDWRYGQDDLSYTYVRYTQARIFAFIDLVSDFWRIILNCVIELSTWYVLYKISALLYQMFTAEREPEVREESDKRRLNTRFKAKKTMKGWSRGGQRKSAFRSESALDYLERNCLKFYATKPDDDDLEPTAHILMVNNKMALINDHILHYNGGVLSGGWIEWPSPDGNTSCRFQHVMFDRARRLDFSEFSDLQSEIVLVTLSICVSGVRNISSHFVSTSERKMFVGRDVGLYCGDMAEDDYRGTVIGIVPHRDCALYEVEMFDETRVGFCGLFYTLGTKILAIHTGSHGNFKYTAPVFREVIKNAMEDLGDPVVDFELLDADDTIPFQFEGQDIEHSCLGKIEGVRCNNPTRTVLVESKISDKATWPDGHAPSVKNKSVLFRECQKYEFLIDNEVPSKAETDYTVKYFATVFREIKARENLSEAMLNDEQILNGSDELCVGPVVVNSSAGYWNVISKQKKDLIERNDDEILVFTEKATTEVHPWTGKTFLETLKERENLAREGKRLKFSPWQTTLKDELLPIEKVQKRGARVFEVPPLDFTLLMRKYFGTFAAMYRTHGGPVLSHGIGLDKESVWGIYYKHLKSRGKFGMAIDYSKFDGSLPPAAFEMFRQVVESFYENSTVEERNVRAVLLHELQFTHLLIDEYNVVTSKGNKSGNWLTDVFNSVVNVWMWRVAYYRLFRGYYEDLPELFDFNRDCCLLTYGDDAIMTQRLGTLEWFRSDAIGDIFTNIGVFATKADKTPLDGKPDKLEDMTFLKSKFIECKRVVLPEMPIECTYKELNFVKKSVQGDRAVEELRYFDAMRMAAYAGQLVYDKLCKQLNARLAFVNEPIVLYLPWRSVYDEIKDKQAILRNQATFVSLDCATLRKLKKISRNPWLSYRDNHME